jgi:8-oxo-dGTP pyrophosphatase MutT (NUDIX family)
MTATRVSFGVILCRLCAETQRPEVLLVRKRYTYAFASLVFGHYCAQNSGGLDFVKPLLNAMTREELILVHAHNFADLWRHIWLGAETRQRFYEECEGKFRHVFLRDGGAQLRRHVQAAHPAESTLWEPPKGRRNAGERAYGCAVREMREETGVDKSEYTFIPQARRSVSHVSAGVRYRSEYFIAAVKQWEKARVASDAVTVRGAVRRPLTGTLSTGAAAEIAAVRWFDIEQLRSLDDVGRRLATLIAPAFAKFRRYRSGAQRARGKHVKRDLVEEDPELDGAQRRLSPAV